MLLGKFSKAEGSLVTESVPGRGLFPVPLPHSVIDSGKGDLCKGRDGFQSRAQWLRPWPNDASGSWRSARCSLMATLRLSHQQAV